MSGSCFPDSIIVGRTGAIFSDFREFDACDALLCSMRVSFLAGSTAPEAFEFPAVTVSELDPTAVLDS